MKANELRIGNYLKYKNLDKFFRVSIIDTTETVTICNAKPIPLTEEWLLKFGFKTTISNKDSGYKQFGLRECKFDFMFTLECNGNPEFFLENVGLDILYVHQLQNLYFSLTGKELTV